MSNKITVITQPKNRVVINTPQKTQLKSVNVVGAGSAGAGVDTLAELRDVDATDSDNNETLVYDSTVQKYVIKTLPIIDGGSY